MAVPGHTVIGDGAPDELERRRPFGIDPIWFRDAEASPEFVTLMDRDDRLLYVNHPQPGAEDYSGAPVYQFVDAEYHEVLRAAVDRARESGVPQRFESYGAGPDGASIHYGNWVMAVHSSVVDGLVAFVATDVTRAGRIEAQLEFSESALRSLAEYSPDTILIADRERRIMYVNQLRYGLHRESVLGEPVESFIPEEHRKKVVGAFEEVLSTGEMTSYGSVFEASDRQREFLTRVVPIPGEGGTERVMLVATDITAQVEAEREQQRLTDQLQQAQKMESLGQLTGGVAHDFNNILVAISGNLELAQMRADDAAEREAHIAAALDAAHHAKFLTERLLAFSRRQTLRPRPVDIGGLVSGMADLLSRSLGETIRVTVDGADNVLTCKVDPAQLESTVLNLAVNARDAMPGGGELRIRMRSVVVTDGDDVSAAPGEYVLLEVEDDGVGMPPEVAVQAFEPFFTTKPEGLGTGLGLSMVYGFVLQSGGHVRLLTEPGSGTTVQIYLQQSSERPSEPAAERRADDVVRGNEELILVVEDNEMVRSLTVELLEHLGYRTVAADGADAALAHLSSDADISLMLTDLVLPGPIDGFALSQRARVLRPGMRVLFVSGYPKDVLAGRGADDVTYDLLMKPFTTQQLADAVDRQTSGTAAETL